MGAGEGAPCGRPRNTSRRRPPGPRRGGPLAGVGEDEARGDSPRHGLDRDGASEPVLAVSSLLGSGGDRGRRHLPPSPVRRSREPGQHTPRRYPRGRPAGPDPGTGGRSTPGQKALRSRFLPGVAPPWALPRLLLRRRGGAGDRGAPRRGEGPLRGPVQPLRATGGGRLRTVAGAGARSRASQASAMVDAVVLGAHVVEVDPAGRPFRPAGGFIALDQAGAGAPIHAGREAASRRRAVPPGAASRCGGAPPRRAAGCGDRPSG
jgi:hypothetical protein